MFDLTFSFVYCHVFRSLIYTPPKCTLFEGALFDTKTDYMSTKTETNLSTKETLNVTIITSLKCYKV